MMNRSKTDNSSFSVEFITNDFNLSLVGYPTWEASIAAAETDCWIKVIPSIDIAKRVIHLPKFLKSPGIADKSILTVRDLKEPLQPYYTELINRFFDSIPPNICEVVSKYADSHWDFIRAIKLLGDDLFNLVKNNPILAYVVVNLDKINQSFFCYPNIDILKRMIKTKQKEILRLAGFPERERIVKIFSKIDPEFINVDDLISLRNLLMIDTQLKERILNTLSFAKTINRNLLELIIYNSPLLSLLSNKIIYELAASESFSEHLKKIKQLYLNSQRWQLTAPKIISLSGINKTFEKQLLAVEKKRQKENAFPTPPLEDNFYITAISQESDLVSWSKRQHNCVRSYTSSIKSKQKYFYKVMYGKEEATLELKITKRQVKKGDLLGTANRSVSQEMKKMVDEWFKENNSKKKKNLNRNCTHSKSVL